MSDPTDVRVRDLVERLRPELGEIEGPPEPLEGGITNRNFRVRARRRRVRAAPAGQGHGPAGHRPRGRARGERDGGASAGVGARGGSVPGRMGDPRHRASSPASRWSRRNCASPCCWPRSRAAARRPRRPATALDLRLLPHRRDLPRHRRAPTEPGSPTPTTTRSRGRAAWSAAMSGPEHAPGALPQRPARRRTSSARTVASRIVDWEYAGMGDRYFDLANLAVNNGFGDADDRAPAGGLLRRARRRAPRSPRCA